MAAAQFWGGMSLREFSVGITFSYSKDTTLVNYIHEILIHSAAARVAGDTALVYMYNRRYRCGKTSCTGYLLIQYWVNLRLGFRWGMLTNCCSFFHVTTNMCKWQSAYNYKSAVCWWFGMWSGFRGFVVLVYFLHIYIENDGMTVQTCYCPFCLCVHSMH